MKMSFALLTLFALTVHIVRAEDSIVPKTLSPDQKVAIAQRDAGDTVDYFFVEANTGKRLGAVLPPHLVGARDVEMEASWSTNGSKVVLLLSYGAKLNALLVYVRDRNGVRRVNVPDLDPIAAYEDAKTGTHFSREGPGYEENAPGPWISDEVVRVIRGNAKGI